jgi:hypothetical protein
MLLWDGNLLLYLRVALTFLYTQHRGEMGVKIGEDKTHRLASCTWNLDFKWMPLAV